MNADAFRHFYAYHFAQNRAIWEQYIVGLSDEEFTRSVPYSHGSVHNQLVHLVDVDEAWFSDLRGIAIPDLSQSATIPDRKELRARWDGVEQNMRTYLTTLRDDMLSEKPLQGEDKNLLLWQVLLHVVNHGTDHRAQLLRALSDLGIETTYQDYIFYTYRNP